jgi:hypothetical protein
VNARSRIAVLVALAVSFAVFVGMTVSLAGRLDGAGLTAALAAGALAAAAFAAPRPIVAARSLPAASAIVACAGGLLAFVAAPAIVNAVRMSDAPAGSVVVFWLSGGWAALAALFAAGVALSRGAGARALAAVAGAAAVLAGAAGIVADWERPSSFSPLVRFPVQELAILGAGVLFIAGGLLLARAGRDGRLPGALVWGSVASVLGASAWVLTAGPARAIGSVGELPVQVVVAAAAWGVVCMLWPPALDGAGRGSAAAALALAPLLLSALVWAEQSVGVAGPQPLIVGGVVAGSLVLASGVLALMAANDATGAPAVRRPLRLLALAPLILAAVGADVKVSAAAGSFQGAWVMTGVESIGVLSALALALVLAAAVVTRRSPWLPLAGLAACLSWAWLLPVPTHVLNTWLAPGIQSYYGTEYGSITFASVQNLPALLAVVVTGVGFLALALHGSGFLRRRPISSKTTEAPTP